MNDEAFISDMSIENLAQKLAQTFSMDFEEALGIVYEEWELVEYLFHTFGKVKLVHRYLTNEINHTYRIA